MTSPQSIHKSGLDSALFLPAPSSQQRWEKREAEPHFTLRILLDLKKKVNKSCTGGSALGGLSLHPD